MEFRNFIPPNTVNNSLPLKKVTIGPKERLPQNLTFHKTGDVIQAIEVRCACGDTIVIQCVYE